METIAFKCSKCQFGLKVGADKAGRKAKCSKCGTVVTIPAANDPPPAAPPPPPPKKDDDDDDSSAGFNLIEAEDLAAVRAEKEKEAKAKIIQKPGRQAIKKKAKITNPYEWRKVGLGSKWMGAGVCIWLAAYLVYHIPVAIGMVVGPEYAAAADTKLFSSGAGADSAPDVSTFVIALIGGEAYSGLMKSLVIFSDVLYLLQYAPLLAGYFICLAAPPRFGIPLQLKVLLGLAVLNMTFLVLFKLLPMIGAIRIAVVPFMAPEVAMIEMNGERMESLFTFWLKRPLVEVYGSILMTFLLYLEPALIATFVYAVGKSIKSLDLEGGGMAAMQLAYSQIFIQTVWIMACLCGTSLVLLWALRFIYTIGLGFFIGQLGYTAYLLFTVAGVVEEQLGDDAPLPGAERRDESGQSDEEEEEEDDEE